MASLASLEAIRVRTSPMATGRRVTAGSSGSVFKGSRVEARRARASGPRAKSPARMWLTMVRTRRQRSSSVRQAISHVPCMPDGPADLDLYFFATFRSLSRLPGVRAKRPPAGTPAAWAPTPTPAAPPPPGRPGRALSRGERRGCFARRAVVGVVRPQLLRC